MTIGFKIRVKQFNDLLQMIQAKDKKPLVEEIIINLEEKNIHIKSVDETEVCLADLICEVAEVDGKGKIPIKIEDMLKYLKRFKSDDLIQIIYDKDASIIVLNRSKPKLTYTIATSQVDYINSEFVGDFKVAENEQGEARFIKDNRLLPVQIELDVDEIVEVVKDGENIENKLYPFIVSDGTLRVIVEDVSSNNKADREVVFKKLTINEEAKKTTKEFKSKFSYGLGNVFKSLDGVVTLFLGNDDFMYIRKIGSKYKLKVLLGYLEEENAEEKDKKEKKETEAEQDKIDKIVKKGKGKKEDKEEGDNTGKEESIAEELSKIDSS